jgi:ArsR family transcriptional regulator, lead/cadmium/zinc/bismuth-responsive transcriptional repressor
VDSIDRCDLLCLDVPKAEALRAEFDGIDLETPALSARALGDVTRLRVAAVLAATDELCVCDLSWIVARSDKLVSHHLRVLREAALVASRRDGKIVFYHLTGPGRALLAALTHAHEVART